MQTTVILLILFVDFIYYSLQIRQEYFLNSLMSFMRIVFFYVMLTLIVTDVCYHTSGIFKSKSKSK